MQGTLEFVIQTARAVMASLAMSCTVHNMSPVSPVHGLASSRVNQLLLCICPQALQAPPYTRTLANTESALQCAEPLQ